MSSCHVYREESGSAKERSGAKPSLPNGEDISISFELEVVNKLIS